MSSIIKLAIELSDEEVSRLFSIHRSVYHSRGIGLPFEHWRTNLTKSYHGRFGKNVQLFCPVSSNHVESYTIFTEPKEIGLKCWSKIIEGAVDSANASDARLLFINIIKDLVDGYYHCAVNFIGEPGTKYAQVVDLMERCHFSKLENIELARKLMTGFLQYSPFELRLRENALVIERSTRYETDYQGYLLIRDCSYRKETTPRECSPARQLLEVI